MIKNIMSKDVKTIDSNSVIKDVISIMDKYDFKEIPIVDSKKKVIGIASYLDLLKVIKFKANSRIINYMEGTPIVNENDSEDYLLNLMIDSGITGVPVINNKDKIIGFVSGYDLIKYYNKKKILDKLLVMDIYIKTVPSIKENDNVSTAKNLMNFNHINRLPVINNKSKFVGTILSLDILRTFYRNPEKIKKGMIKSNLSKIMNIPIKELVRKNTSIKYNSPLSEAINKMIKNNLMGISVINELNEPLGVLTRQSILRKIRDIISQHEINIDISCKLNKEYISNIKKTILQNIKILPYFKLKIKNIRVIIKRIHNNRDNGKVEIHFNIKKEGKDILIKRINFDLFLTLMNVINTANKLLKKEYLDKFKK